VPIIKPASAWDDRRRTVHKSTGGDPSKSLSLWTLWAVRRHHELELALQLSRTLLLPHFHFRQPFMRLTLLPMHPVYSVTYLSGPYPRTARSDIRDGDYAMRVIRGITIHVSEHSGIASTILPTSLRRIFPTTI
jgi:hypothetical protein